MAETPLEAKKEDGDAEKDDIKYQVLKKDFEKGYKERRTGRFAHTRPYVASVLAKYDFKVLTHDDIVSRTQGPALGGGLNVSSQLVVAELLK